VTEIVVKGAKAAIGLASLKRIVLFRIENPFRRRLTRGGQVEIPASIAAWTGFHSWDLKGDCTTSNTFLMDDVYNPWAFIHLRYLKDETHRQLHQQSIQRRYQKLEIFAGLCHLVE
jgi:hypothetical protein